MNVMIPDHVFGALVFVFVEVMFYSAFLSSFFVMKRGRDSWGQNDAQALPAFPEGFNGLVLGLSLACILLALRALPRGGAQSSAVARNHLLRALGLAVLFSVYQFILGAKLYAGGVTLGSSVFAGCMYLMLGSHLIQAVLGSLWIGKLLLDLGRSKPASAGALKGLAVFWCFLFAIWPVMYVELFF